MMLQSDLLHRLTQDDANLRPSASELRIKVQDLLCQHLSDVHEQSRSGKIDDDTLNKNPQNTSIKTETKTFISTNNINTTNNSSSHNVISAQKYVQSWTNNISHRVNGVSSRTLETRDDLLVRDSVNGDERFEPLLRLAKVQDLEIQVEVLRTELRQRDYQIRTLKEQVNCFCLV